MSKPRLLDLFCGAGGAAMGYARAGFEVVGVDIKPQPHYPFYYLREDALAYLEDVGGVSFDAIHASPPCQRYSMFSRNMGTAAAHPDLVEKTRGRLKATGLPWVMENVIGSPLRRDLILCGCMFGLGVRRRRVFELEPPTLGLVPSCAHIGLGMPAYGHGTPQWYRRALGRNITADEVRQAMGIDWMTREEVVQAVPPAYTQWIGERLLAALKVAA